MVEIIGYDIDRTEVIVIDGKQYTVQWAHAPTTGTRLVLIQDDESLRTWRAEVDAETYSDALNLTGVDLQQHLYDVGKYDVARNIFTI